MITLKAMRVALDKCIFQLHEYKCNQEIDILQTHQHWCLWPALGIQSSESHLKREFSHLSCETRGLRFSYSITTSERVDVGLHTLLLHYQDDSLCAGSQCGGLHLYN